jgi:hypothetical protein
MPICVHSALLDLSMERQGVFPGILLPAHETSDPGAPSLVVSDNYYSTGLRREHNLVPDIVHIIHDRYVPL